jgi:hypothetical protein
MCTVLLPLGVNPIAVNKYIKIIIIIVGKWVKLDCAQFVSNFRVEVVVEFNYFYGFPDDVQDSRSEGVLGHPYYQI